MPKISALPTITTPDGSDELAIVDVSDNTTKRITLTKVKDWLVSLVGWITTAMIADKAVTSEKLSATVAFRAYRSLSDSVSTTPEKVAMEELSFDIGGNYDLDNLRFEVPYDGIYDIFGQVYFTDPGDNNRVLCFIFVNGSLAAGSQIGTAGGTTDPSITVRDLVSLTAGDYVEIYAQVTSGSVALATGSTKIYFTGLLVGRTD
jgi:hypothetical protein